MPQLSKLAEVLNGTVQNVDLSTQDLVTNSVYYGGAGGTQLTKTVLDSLISNSHAPSSDNQTVVAGNGLTGGGSGATVTLDVGAGSGISVAADTVAVDNTVVRTNGANAFTADQSFGGFKATNLADPLSAQDAATKNYVDNSVQAESWKTVVRSATTGALASYTYSNGSSGVGATITASSNGALAAQDGVTLVANDRLLVKNESGGNQPNNGIYVVTQVGDGSHPFILTRAVDLDDASEFFGATVEVGPEASTQGGFEYRQTTANPITVGTSNIVWVNSSQGSALTFRNGLSQTGSNVDVVPGDNSLTSTPGSLVVKEDPAGAISTGASGIKVNTDGSTTQISSNNIAVKLDAAGALTSSGSGIKVNLESSNPTLQISSDQLGVKLDGSRAITTGASGIGVNVDGTSIDINSNAVEIKSQGVTAAKIATSAVDGTTITGGGGSALSAQNVPLVKNRAAIAGQSFSANTTYAVRWGQPANSETAGRLYAADKDSTSQTNYNAVGVIQPTGSIVAGNTVILIKTGMVTLQSGDTNFSSSDVGTPAMVGSSGVVIPISSLTNASKEAAYVVGEISDVNKIDVGNMHLRGIA